MVKEVITYGSSVVEIGFLAESDLEHGNWYRSKERKGGLNPFGSFMLNKKWTLEEEFNNHILRFQQVKLSLNYLMNYSVTFQAGLTVIEVNFKTIC